MNSRRTPETNLRMTVMLRRRHHRSHQGREEKSGKIITKGGNFNSNKSDGAKRKYDVPEVNIASIPGYILYKIKPEDVRKYHIQWRGIYNDKKRTIRVHELQRKSRHESGNDSDAETEASQESPRPRRKVKDNINRRVKTARKTTVKNSGLANQTVRVSMKDEDNDSESDHIDKSTSSNSEESSEQNTSKVRSLTRKKNGGKTVPTEGTMAQNANAGKQDEDEMT